jgi:hypothetical protein
LNAAQTSLDFSDGRRHPIRHEHEISMARNRSCVQFRSFHGAGNAFSGTMKRFSLDAVGGAFAAILERLKRTKILAATTLLTLLLAPHPIAAPAQSVYALKAAFLYNLCRFVDWPDSAFASPNEPLIIGIAGDDPFGSLLSDAVKGKKYHNRPIRIDHFRAPGDIRRCHLLFVSRANARRFHPILAALAGRSVLTVSETEDFLTRGGMVALTAEQNRVHLRINRAALQSANLTVSSKLLRVAEINP